MTSTDRALAAVARVRGARERDSRLGLAHALAERSRRERAATLAADRVVDAACFGAGTPADYVAHAVRGAWLAEEMAEARRTAERAAVVAAEAGHHWRADRMRTRVVELLLERHAEQRRAERARAESRLLDEIAGQAWLRSRTGDGPR